MRDRRPCLDLAVPPPIPGRIAVVGICASGKSTLVEGLRWLGYDAHQCGQEHSHVPDMWQRLSRPEVLIYLHGSTATVRSRRNIALGPDLFGEQRKRLEHARRHCQVYVDTDALGIDEVLAQVLQALASLGFAVPGDPG